MLISASILIISPKLILIEDESLNHLRMGKVLSRGQSVSISSLVLIVSIIF